MGKEKIGLLDSGSMVTILHGDAFLSEGMVPLKSTRITLKAANGGSLKVLGCAVLEFSYREQRILLETIVVEYLGVELILGYDFWQAMGFRLLDSDHHSILQVSAKSPSHEPEISLSLENRTHLQKVCESFLVTSDYILGQTDVVEHEIELIAVCLETSPVCPSSGTENESRTRSNVSFGCDRAK